MVDFLEFWHKSECTGLEVRIAPQQIKLCTAWFGLQKRRKKKGMEFREHFIITVFRKYIHIIIFLEILSINLNMSNCFIASVIKFSSHILHTYILNTVYANCYLCSAGKHERLVTISYGHLIQIRKMLLSLFKNLPQFSVYHCLQNPSWFWGSKSNIQSSRRKPMYML